MKHEFKVTRSKEQTVYTLESATGGSSSTAGGASVSTALGGVQRRSTDSIFAQEAKKEEPKPRNFVAKNAKMGGAGQHKDKKKAAKQGAVKHKKPLAESYAEDLAKQVFDANPNIKDENAVLDAAWPIVVQDLGKKTAMSMFNYDEDFPSDLVSVYGWLQKGTSEGVSDLSYDAQSLITKLRRDVEEKRLQPTPEAVLAAARELAGDMDFAPQLLVKQVLGQGVAEGLQARLAELKNKVKEAYGRYDRRDAYQRDYDHSVAGMDRGNNHRDDERHDLDPSDWYIVKDGKMYKTSVYPRQEQEALSRGYSRTREEAKAKAEQGVAEVAPPGWEKTVKAMKKHDNIDNPFALAWSMKNKGYKSHKKESADPYFESLRAKVEELAKK